MKNYRGNLFQFTNSGQSRSTEIARVIQRVEQQTFTDYDASALFDHSDAYAHVRLSPVAELDSINRVSALLWVYILTCRSLPMITPEFNGRIRIERVVFATLALANICKSIDRIAFKDVLDDTFEIVFPPQKSKLEERMDRVLGDLASYERIDAESSVACEWDTKDYDDIVPNDVFNRTLRVLYATYGTASLVRSRLDDIEEGSYG